MDIKGKGYQAMDKAQEVHQKVKSILNNAKENAGSMSYKKAQSGAEGFARSFLSDEGMDAIKKRFSSVFEDVSTSGLGFGIGALAEIGMTTFGTQYRMKRGESFGEAFTKELAEGVMYGLAPELLIGVVGKEVAKAYPKLNSVAEQKKSMNQNFKTLGGDYIDSKTNYASRARALEQIKRTRSTIAASIGGEARRHHRT